MPLRRLYYVAMTRARQTLALACFPGPHPLQNASRGISSVLLRREAVKLPPAAPELARSYRRLSLRDGFLSFPGYRPLGHPVHRAIAALSSGDLLQVRVESNRWELLDRNRMVVGQLAGVLEAPTSMHRTFAKVLAVVAWDRESSEPQYWDRLQRDTWEVVLPELVFEPDP